MSAEYEPDSNDSINNINRCPTMEEALAEIKKLQSDVNMLNSNYADQESTIKILRKSRDSSQTKLVIAVAGINKAIGYGNRLDIYKVLNETLAKLDMK